MALTVTEIQQLYTAYLGRPADREGLEYWQEAGVSASELRANLANDEQAEYVLLYGDRSREEVITAIYENMFGRAPEAEGLAYWLEGGGAAVPESDLQHLFIEAASEADRDAFNGRVAEHEAGIPEAEEPGSTTDIIFNTNVQDSDESHISVDPETGNLVINPVTPIDYVGETISNIGLAEWGPNGATTTSVDYTFKLSNQLGADKTYEGLFLSPLLTSDTITSNSQLFVELLDVRSVDSAQDPLTNLPIDGFSFELDGTPVALRDITIYEADTYQQLVDAINAVIDATPALAGFSAELGGTFVANDGNDPIPGAIGETIVLTDANGRDISGGTFTYTDQVTSGFTLYGELSTEAPRSDQLLIETNLDLDNVGYGSQGGTVNLAGESNSDKGVELFDVTANNGVWLTRLESEAPSGKHFLKEVNVTGSGYLNIGIQDGGADNDKDVLGLEELLTTTVGGLNDAGLIDVQTFNGTGFVGDIKLNAYISDAVIERDLQSQDVQNDPAAEDVTYAYQTAAGDDQISLAVDEALLARADSQLVINAGNGDNVVETGFVDAFGGLLTNQQLNGNVTIITGNGADVVRSWGGGDAKINTGAGADVVYADNSGLVTAGADFWEFNSQSEFGFVTGVSNSDAPLSSGANGVAQSFNVVNNANVQVQVAFKGFESVWIDVPTTRTAGDNDDTITTLQVNQAIKQAVNEHKVLQNLIEASDGNGNILNIESLIDGNNLDQLEVAFRDNNGDTTADLTAIEAIYGVDLAGSTATNFGGGNSSAESDNTINAGAGNDVIVLGTGVDSNDTVQLEGNFGNDSIVNFTAGELASVTGADILDFTSYGVNGAARGSDDYAVANDEVNVVDFSAAAFDRTDVNFGNLNAADVKQAIGTEVVNGRIDSIILVQGNDAGTYKAFDVNSANNSTDFTVDLIGVLDFGASQAFVADNFA